MVMTRTLEDYCGEFWVSDDRLVGDTDISIAINKTLVRANAAGGGKVILPFGNYTKTTATPAIQLFSNIELVGAGRGITTITYDDSNVGSTGQLFAGGTSGARLTNITLRDFSVRGWLDTVSTARYHLLVVNYVDNITVENVSSKYSRLFGMVLNYCTNVTVKNCLIERARHDGIACWSSSGISIINNHIIECGDDAISCHAQDTDTSPVRSGVIIEGNNITSCNGIKALGLHSGSISNNVLRRVHSYGIFAGADIYSEQGNTPESGVVITGNIINDVLYHPTAANGYHSYIILGGIRQSAGSGNAVPGKNYAVGDSVIDLYGATTGNFYNNDVDDSATLASPGSWFFKVHNNNCSRTLPAVTNYSDWGHGQLFCISSTINPAVTAANLTPLVGVWVHGSMRNTMIDDNIISNTIVAIKFTALDLTSPVALSFADFFIRRNHLWQFTTAGILWDATTPTSPQDIVIEGNFFDGDPLRLNSNRAAAGTWTASGAPTAIDLTKMKGAKIQRNSFKNVCRLFLETTANDNFVDDNTVRCQPGTNIGAFSTSNKGVGFPISGGNAWKYIIEDCDHTSATFGQTIFNPSPNQRTNLLRNNTSTGASAGTPGTKPTNWNGFGAQDSLTTSIIGTSVENGIDCIDVKIAGTASASSQIGITFESATEIAASKGDVITASSFRKLVAGSMTGITRIEDYIQEYAPASSFVGTRALGSANNPTSASLMSQRQSCTLMVLGATTTVIRSGILFTYTNGGVIDITLRIGLPQLERGVIATAPIRTTTAAVTKVSNTVFDELKDLFTVL